MQSISLFENLDIQRNSHVNVVGQYG